MAERVPAPSIDYFGCDRCGNTFQPGFRNDVLITASDGSQVKHQLCDNCKNLLTMTFRFTDARKVMEKQLFGG